ncbi:short-chain dehydrogenase/reductase SDR [Gaertneriomyces semiglobifer]|nr:short-chain dehydrogenase/reductase SDR [Gaertneriomyces semiglobifer]
MPSAERTIRDLSALVTGASRGIGRAVAVGLAQEGCRVALVARNAEKLEQVRSECMNAGAQEALVLPCDVTNDEDTQKVVDTIKSKFGTLNILVNNSGIGGAGDAFECDWEGWKNVMDVNLLSCMRMTKLALPLLKSSGRGYIINIASLAGRRTMKGNVDYATSKAGVIQFSNSLFEDVRDANIKVCSISPGYVATDMVKNVNRDHAKFILPEDIADTVLYVTKLSPSACPTEIVIRPQLTP